MLLIAYLLYWIAIAKHVACVLRQLRLLLSHRGDDDGEDEDEQNSASNSGPQNPPHVQTEVAIVEGGRLTSERGWLVVGSFYVKSGRVSTDL